MKYKKYQHIERLSSEETKGILDGTVYIYSKLDGTNTVIYLNDDGELKVGSRNRVLTLEQDNQGCMAYVVSEPKFKEYLDAHPNHYLYGEFLIKNQIKDYEDDAWRKVYIFDVVEVQEDSVRYLSYEEYVPLLEEYGLDYIPLIAKLDHPTQEQVMEYVDKCTYKMKDNASGEGVVLKSYDYKNPYGRTTWAKIVRSQFKVSKKAGVPMDNTALEAKIIEDLFTPEFIEKEYCKIVAENDGVWTSKLIPKFLGIIWHTFIVEEAFNIVKTYNQPKIDFRLLHKFANERIKEVKKELFC